MQEVGENARVPAVVRRGFQVSLVTVADRDNGPNGAKVFGRSAPSRPGSGARVICVWLAVAFMIGSFRWAHSWTTSGSMHGAPAALAHRRAPGRHLPGRTGCAFIKLGITTGPGPGGMSLAGHPDVREGAGQLERHRLLGDHGGQGRVGGRGEHHVRGAVG